ncbi:MAG: hypothetical protein NC388_09210 [Clostridium sp.]|nr:hypothetical protein [Clostridium sp.]
MQKLFLELKNYLELQKKFVMLDTAEKLTVLISAIAIGSVVLILLSMLLLFATLALAYYLGDLLHSLPLGFALIAALFGVILFYFYANRNKLVIQPLARMMADLFINPHPTDEKK